MSIHTAAGFRSWCSGLVAALMAGCGTPSPGPLPVLAPISNPESPPSASLTTTALSIGAVFPARIAPYWTQAESLASLNALDARIREHRTGALTVQVLDAAGRPMDNVPVTITLRRHCFSFGVDVPPRVPLDAWIPSLPLGMSRVLLEEDFRWSRWSTTMPDSIRNHTKERLSFLQEHGMEIQAGALVWPGWTRPNPHTLRTLNPDDLAKKIRARIEELVSVGAPHVAAWHVVQHPGRDRDFQERLGPTALGDWFRYAHAAAPSARLFLVWHCLPFTSEEQVLLQRVIQEMRLAAVPFHGVAIDFRPAHVLPPPEEIEHALAFLGTLKFPVEIIFHDPLTSHDEAEARFALSFLRSAYASPYIAGITHRQSAHSHIRELLLHLVGSEWNGSGTPLTDALGNATASLHHGRYDITVDIDGTALRREVDLLSPTSTVVIKLPKANASASSPQPSLPPSPRPSPPSPAPAPINLDQAPRPNP